MSSNHELEVIFQKRTPTQVCVKLDEDSRDIWIPKRDCGIRARDEARGLVRGEVAILTADEYVLIDNGLV